MARSSRNIELSGEGLVATKAREDYYYQLATGGEPMTEGRHYWEVEITDCIKEDCAIFFGAVRPGMDYEETHHDDGTHGSFASSCAYFIFGCSGALFGIGKDHTDRQGMFAKGDRIGCLLDLDEGWLRFYRNDVLCGPGFTEGVTGPLVRAVELRDMGDVVTVLSGAEAPEG
jgi:hypothetical protein